MSSISVKVARSKASSVASPVSDSLRATGATEVLAGHLAAIGTGLPAYAALGLILVASMSVTPFLNNAATVLVMAPIAAGFAARSTRATMGE